MRKTKMKKKEFDERNAKKLIIAFEEPNDIKLVKEDIIDLINIKAFGLAS